MALNECNSFPTAAILHLFSTLVNSNTCSHLTLDEHVKELVVRFGGVCAGHDLAEDHLSSASAAVFS